MKEEKGIIHRGRGAYLRCPVSTAVQFSLRDEGSTEYMCVRGRYLETIYIDARVSVQRRYDMNRRFQMQEGKNWILPK